MMARDPGFLTRVSVIGTMTLRELLRDRILYSSIFFGTLLLIVSYMMASLSLFRPIRVLLDVGLSGTQISAAVIAILASGATLNREFERRTVHMLLSRPVSPLEFIVGKWLGVVAITTLNLVLLAAIHFGCLHAFAVNGITDVAPVQLQILLVAWAMTIVFVGALSALSFLTASISSAAVTFMIGIGVYLIGTNLSTMLLMAKRQGGLSRVVLETLARFFPNLEALHLNTNVSAGLTPAPSELWMACLNAFGWTVVSLFLASLLVRKKESLQ